MNSKVSKRSKFGRLYHLYSFDLSPDVVYDIMYILNPNMLNFFIKHLFGDIQDQPNNNCLLLSKEVVNLSQAPACMN
jgi:hypothetical protein